MTYCRMKSTNSSENKIPSKVKEKNVFEKELKSKIKLHGPMNISQFMLEVLSNPHKGYYTTKENVLGSAGDFVTAPEISQMFGECIAACRLQCAAGEHGGWSCSRHMLRSPVCKGHCLRGVSQASTTEAVVLAHVAAYAGEASPSQLGSARNVRRSQLRCTSIRGHKGQHDPLVFAFVGQLSICLGLSPTLPPEHEGAPCCGAGEVARAREIPVYATP